MQTRLRELKLKHDKLERKTEFLEQELQLLDAQVEELIGQQAITFKDTDGNWYQVEMMPDEGCRFTITDPPITKAPSEKQLNYLRLLRWPEQHLPIESTDAWKIINQLRDIRQEGLDPLDEDPTRSQEFLLKHYGLWDSPFPLPRSWADAYSRLQRLLDKRMPTRNQFRKLEELEWKYEIPNWSVAHDVIVALINQN